ncbi:hypothetical protein GGR53DRAFT_13678 [Hypoxylon sp. FL1150]|nr:hypothetical protein GGR53DRAFT_13678 [Hypoxylon sp. FL1150]
MDTVINDENEVDLIKARVLEVTPNAEPNRAYISKHWKERSRNGIRPEEYQYNQDLMKAIDVLNILQTTRDQPITKNSLFMTLQHVRQNQSRYAKADTNILAPGHSSYFGDDMDAFNAVFEMDLRQSQGLIPAEYCSLFLNPYNFWPIDVGPMTSAQPHWATAIIHLKVNMDPRRNHYTLHSIIESIAVVDPDRRTIGGRTHSERERQSFNRIVTILDRFGFTYSNNFQASGPGPRDVWIPPINPIIPRPAPNPDPNNRGNYLPPAEDFSSGLHCFWLIRLYLNRVSEMYCHGRAHSDQIFWSDAPGFFSPDLVRQEMLGYAAAVIHQMLEYNTRTAIEPILKMAIHDTPINFKELKPNSTWHSCSPYFQQVLRNKA